MTGTPLRRRRVAGLIEAALRDGAVSLLIAPPGYGKSIALRETIGDDKAFRWVEFAPGTRLEDVVRLITEAAVPEHRTSVPALFSGSGTAKDFERVVEWMARRLRLFEGSIVIDDLHCCFGDPQAVTFLSRIIELTSSYVRWIAASREVPSLPIGTWVARGLMALPITDEELAFTLDEAVLLADSRGIAVDRDVLRLIVEDSGGWPMALHLALQLWERTRSIAPLQIRTREVLFSQIETELWPHVEPAVRDVIFACALMPECNSIVLEAAGFLDGESLLERAHNTVPFVQHTLDGGYALHDLFADFVRKMILRNPTDLAALRDRLATGLLSAGRFADALGVLVAGGDTPRILDVLADVGFPLIEQGHRAAVAAALSFLSTNGHRSHPVVAALRGVLSYADGSTANAEALFVYAYEHGLPPAMRVETGRRLATAYLNRGEGADAVALLEPLIADVTLAALDRIELRSSYAAALATAARNDDSRRAVEVTLNDISKVTPEMRARILQRLAFAAYSLGDLGRAAAFARDAAQLADSLNMWFYAALAHSVLYVVTSMTESDSSIAVAHARMTYAAGEKAGDAGLAALGLRAEYVLHAYRGDEVAFDAAELRLSRFHDVRTFRSSFPARIARALADTIRGRARKAISTLTVIDSNELSGAEHALRDAMLALFLFLADRSDESAALLKSPLLLEASGDFLSRRYVNIARVTRGMALWCHDRTAQARRVFRFDEAAVAENDRVLIDTVTALCAVPRHLVQRRIVDEALSRLHAYGWGGYSRLFEMILAKVEPATNLTPAEIKTLRAFQNGANTVKVAGDLGKSPHTIEAQLKSAYKKIGCVSRAEALVYARSRGWLDDERVGIPETC
jgi:ATP/maltotriose-dependent transcriptional regulator MalT